MRPKTQWDKKLIILEMKSYLTYIL
jgi:hypothetical protein